MTLTANISLGDRKDWGPFDPDRQSEFGQTVTTPPGTPLESVADMLRGKFQKARSWMFPEWPGEPEFLYNEHPIYDLMTGEFLGIVREWAWYAVIDNQYITNR